MQYRACACGRNPPESICLRGIGFYTTGNQALSAYVCEKDGHFAEGTVMARCEREVEAAISAGILNNKTDAHTMSMDACTIVKGCVFEWALNNGQMDMHAALTHILRRCFATAFE